MKKTLPSPTRRQRGVIMVIALVTLAILLIGAVAAIRSMSVTLTSVGNFGFKRDMGNQAERAFAQITTLLNSGGLSTAAARQTSSTALNYSATILTTSPEGIPTAMLDASNLDTVGGLGVASNVINLTGTGTDQGLKIHYLIDRLCQNTGALSTDTCQTASNPAQGGPRIGGLAGPAQPVFRITVRITGPRNSQTFYQATYSAS